MSLPMATTSTATLATITTAPSTTAPAQNKGKAAANTAKTPHTGIYKSDAVKDVAESLNVTLNDAVAIALASDVEYRIHQVVEEAARFMRHGRRTTLTTSDIDQAFRVLNIEPLYGHSSFNAPSYKRALPFPSAVGLNAIPGQAGSSSGQGSGAQGPGAVWFVEDEEIDFDRVLREEKIVLPRGVHWTAHWLAVEGVQPLIPENPPAIPRDNLPAESSSKTDSGLLNGSGPLTNGLLPGSKKPGATAGGTGQASSASPSTPLVKHVLSRELQLYYNRLTTSLLPPSNDFTKRTAALASLRQDAGLQALLPYLIRWVGEGVVGALRETGENAEEDTKTANGAAPAGPEAIRARTLDVLMDVIAALLENGTLFVEPYLHQLLPPILSTLLHSSLPSAASSTSSSSSSSVPNANPTPTHLRTSASSTLSRLLRQHSTTYPSLSPRIMKTLLLALLSPSKVEEGSKKNGTREGAIRGLIGVGKEAVRKGIVEGGGARVVERECEGFLANGMSDGEGEEGLVNSVMNALEVLKPSVTANTTAGSSQDMDVDPSPTVPLNLNDQEDAAAYERLKELVGDSFAERVMMAGDREWVREIVGVGRG